MGSSALYSGTDGTRVISITSGKGGVGKTSLVCNLPRNWAGAASGC